MQPDILCSLFYEGNLEGGIVFLIFLKKILEIPDSCRSTVIPSLILLFQPLLDLKTLK